ncbi:hypothetical protein IFR05_008878 [Cadophora sp. M221]|nr:hypothetical protein IFR05_008878 [Cadophora sp. M221]
MAPNKSRNKKASSKVVAPKSQKKTPSKAAAPKSQKKKTPPKALSPNTPTTNLEDAEVQYEIISANAQALKKSKHTGKEADGDKENGTAGMSVNASVDVTAEALSQLATAAGKNPVQISGTILAALLSNISNINTDLQDLKYGSGKRFALFPKLPLELRTMIWDFAAFVPRVFGIRFCEGNEFMKPSTGPYLVRYICSESRRAAMKVQKVIIDQVVIGENGLFFNPLVDIAYFHAPEDVPLGDIYNYHIYMVESLEQDDYFSRATPSGSLDLVFIEPRQPVGDLLSASIIEAMSELLTFEEDINIEDMSWEEIEKAEMEMIRFFMEYRTEWRLEMIEDNIDPDTCDEYCWYERQSCDDWTLEKIQFVELITRQEFNQTEGLKEVH